MPSLRKLSELIRSCALLCSVLAVGMAASSSACGSKEPVNNTLRDDLEVTTYFARVSDGLSDRIEFDVPADIDSFLIEVRGKRGLFYLTELLSPTKKDIVEQGNIVTRGARGVAGLVDWLYPNKEGQGVKEGTYTLTVRGVDAFDNSRLNEDIEIWVYTSKAKSPKSCGIRVDFLVDDAALGAESYEAAVDRIAATVDQKLRQVGIEVIDYGKYRLNMQSSDINLGNGSAVAVVDDVLARTLPLGAARPNAIHILLVRSIGGSDNPTFDPAGYSMGLPGPYAGNLGTSAVLVATGKYVNASGALDADGLASSLTHEIGHFLGLYHTSERNGDGNDPLLDTPQCADAFLCSEEFRRNIMTSSFWLQSRSPASRNRFSKAQGKVMRGHPLCEPMEVVRVDPPIEQCTLACSAPKTCAVISGTMNCKPACDPTDTAPCTSGTCEAGDLGKYVCK